VKYETLDHFKELMKWRGK